MRRDITNQGNTRGLGGYAGIGTASNSMMDDPLLLLVEQGDDLAFGTNRPIQPPTRPIQIPHNRPLLICSGKWKRCVQEALVCELKTRRPDAPGPDLQLPMEWFRTHKIVHESREGGRPLSEPINAVGGADNSMMQRDAEATSPRPQAVDNQVSRPAKLIPTIRLGFKHRHICRVSVDNSTRR